MRFFVFYRGDFPCSMTALAFTRDSLQQGKVSVLVTDEFLRGFEIVNSHVTFGGENALIK